MKGDTSKGGVINWDAELRTHDSWLRSVVAARVGERQAIDEVMQEIALAAVGALSPPRDVAKIPPWLYQVAVRQTMLYRRRQGRHRRLVASFSERAETRQVADPLDWLIADEQGQLVRTALAQLPVRDREILLLKYGQNWKYREIAQHMGTTHSAVEARLHRARRRLREQLARLERIHPRGRVESPMSPEVRSGEDATSVFDTD